MDNSLSLKKMGHYPSHLLMALIGMLQEEQQCQQGHSKSIVIKCRQIEHTLPLPRADGKS